MATENKAVEFEGNTVEDAINRAVIAMNVSRETLQIKIVCEEQKGLFGMQGATPAKIKVKIKDSSTG